ncbi:hypothetical protein F5Y16DRAFT_157551 [Xylariaceae sp. FL0255]|nr:hypothetical protein F5Y16DRAFT_157551 [Xylariaceae sp. FL0255]
MPPQDDAEDDELFLPGRDQVYVTLTKKGKPALARKKNDSLLSVYGFDLLGETFGIPSRGNFDLNSRRVSFSIKSVKSQSSGITTPSSTRKKGKKRLNDQVFAYDGTESPGRTPEHVTKHSSSPSLDHSTRNENKPLQPPDQPRQPPQPVYPVHHAAPFTSPPPPPPPPAVIGLYGPPPTAPPPNHLPPYNNGPAYPVPGTAPIHGPMPWNTMQQPTTAQYPQFPGFAMNHTMPQPIPPYNPQQRPYTWPFSGPAAPETNMFPPPPPPPPPPSMPAMPPMPPMWQGPPAGANKVEEARTNEPKGATGAIPAHQPSTQFGDARHTSADNRNSKTDEQGKHELAKRILHTHVCAACGKRRSKRYQKAHPLEIGEIPEPDYCSRCLEDAADLEYDKHRSEHSSDSLLPKSGYKYGERNRGKPRGNSRWAKRSGRLGPLSRLFSRKPRSRGRSTSSSEDPRLRSPSSSPERNIAQSAARNREPSTRFDDATTPRRKQPTAMIHTPSQNQTLNDGHSYRNKNHPLEPSQDAIKKPGKKMEDRLSEDCRGGRDTHTTTQRTPRRTRVRRSSTVDTTRLRYDSPPMPIVVSSVAGSAAKLTTASHTRATSNSGQSEASVTKTERTAADEHDGNGTKSSFKPATVESEETTGRHHDC